MHLCPETHAIAQMANNRQRTSDLNWIPKVAPRRVATAFLDISRGMVGRLTAKREVLDWTAGAEPILSVFQ